MIRTQYDTSRASAALHLANLALQDGLSFWASYNVRRTICAAINKHPQLCVGVVLTNDTNSSGDLSWRGLLADSRIVKCLRKHLTGDLLSALGALVEQSRGTTNPKREKHPRKDQ